MIYCSNPRTNDVSINVSIICPDDAPVTYQRTVALNFTQTFIKLNYRQEWKNHLCYCFSHLHTNTTKYLYAFFILGFWWVFIRMTGSNRLVLLLFLNNRLWKWCSMDESEFRIFLFINLQKFVPDAVYLKNLSRKLQVANNKIIRCFNCTQVDSA